MTTAKLDLPRTRTLLQTFKFKEVFIEELGWSNPTIRRPEPLTVKGQPFVCTHIAQLGGVVVIEVTSNADKLPDAATCEALQKEIEKRYKENLLIFVAQNRQLSLWYWVKHELVGKTVNKRYPRLHYFSHTQPGDLFLSKLSAIVVDVSELDERGEMRVTDVAARLKRALDIERTTSKFYAEFKLRLIEFTDLIEIKDERDRQWYASVLLNRLMFIYFLQGKLFLDGGNTHYLQTKLARYQSSAVITAPYEAGYGYYSEFLTSLFFKGFALPEAERDAATRQLIGQIRYLNGGLFLPHEIERKYAAVNSAAVTGDIGIRIPDRAFVNLLKLFEAYSWNLNDTPGGADNEINPDVLGYIFEKYINQKEFGAYYTRPQITEYLCEQTIYRVILNQLAARGKVFDTMPAMLIALDAGLCRDLLDILPTLSLLDPSCGSGAFLVAAMKTLINVYTAVVGRIEFLNDTNLSAWLKNARTEHKSLNYFIKKRIITDNLFGVDIMSEATEIARLRLFLALVASANTVDELEPLPNIDFNILAGNSLIGLLRVDESAFDQHFADPEQLGLGIAPRQMGLGLSTAGKTFAQLVGEKDRLIETYRHNAQFGEYLKDLRADIDKHRHEANRVLNELLLEQFQGLGIMFEQATWDNAKNAAGKVKKRALLQADINWLTPFHWGYEFNKVMNERGGFDAIITNPPWEIFKPQAKEFFAEYSDLVSKNKMTIKAFEQTQDLLLQDSAVRAAWLDYQSRFPHVSAFYRAAPQFANQISMVNGKKAGSDINLYKLFTEQCYNLLRPDGLCGIVIPSGIYTDLGAKQLRELLFARTRITGLFCFENRKEIFEGVHRSFKFVVLSFEKRAQMEGLATGTQSFPAAFMRHDVAELEHFPQHGALQISVSLLRKLSPDSLSVMEFKSELDVQIAQKMLRFPLLGEQIAGVWNLKLTAEFHMTNDSGLFKTEPAKGRLPLYEGKMIHQYDAHFAEPRYWVDEIEGRKAVLGHRVKDTGQVLDYQRYRLGFRDIASNTNTRTLISTLIPVSFHGNKLPTLKVFDDDGILLINILQQNFLCALWNTFILDWMLRLKVTTTVNFFYLYQLPIPRLTARDPAFAPLVKRAARLICTTPEFDALAKEVGLGSHTAGARDPSERAKLRAEIDGLVAHLYGLTEDEFVHVLNAFPLVAEPVKEAARNAYRDVARGLVK